MDCPLAVRNASRHVGCICLCMFFIGWLGEERGVALFSNFCNFFVLSGALFVDRASHQHFAGQRGGESALYRRAGHLR